MQIVCLSVCLSVCQPCLKSDASEVQHPKLWEFEDHITPIVWFVGDRVSHETAVGKHRHRHTPHNGVPGRTVLVFTSEQVMHSAQMHLPLPTSTDAPPLTHLNRCTSPYPPQQMHLPLPTSTQVHLPLPTSSRCTSPYPPQVGQLLQTGKSVNVSLSAVAQRVLVHCFRVNE